MGFEAIGHLSPDDATVFKGGLAAQSVIQVRLSSPVIATDDALQVEVSTQSGGRLAATLTHMVEEGAASTRTVQLNPGGGIAQFEKLEEGVYQIVVAPTQAGLLAALPPVSDYVLVLPKG